MKNINIILLVTWMLSLSCWAFSKPGQLTVSLTFQDGQIELTQSQIDTLNAFIPLWNKYSNQVFTRSITIEGRTADMGNYQTDKATFKKRVNAIVIELNKKNIQGEQVGLEAFLFSKDLEQVANLGKHIQPNQLIRIHFFAETLKNISERAEKVRQASSWFNNQPIRQEKTDTVSVQCNRFNNATVFYNCEQHLRILTFGGAEIFIPKGTIKGCQEGMTLYLNFNEALNISALREKFRYTKVGKKGLRLAGFIYLGVGTRKEILKVKGRISIKLPLPKITEPQLFFSNNERMSFQEVKASFKAEKRSRYQLNYQAENWVIDYQADFIGSTSLAIGKTTNASTIISIEDKMSRYSYKKGNMYERPAVVYSDSTVAIIPAVAKTKHYGMHGFYTLPIFKEDSLTSTLKASFVLIDNERWDKRRLAMLPELQSYVLEEAIEMDFDRRGNVKNTRKKRIKGRKKPVFQGINTQFKLILFRPKVLTKDPRKD